MNKSFHSLRAPREIASGFTLTELLITMVILTILVAVAVPSYTSFVQQSRRKEAQSALLDLASLEERFFSINNAYTTTPSNLGYTAAATPFNVGNGFYQISAITVVAAVAPTTAIPGGTPATYSITAVPVPGNPQASDSACTSFVVTSGGGKSAFKGAVDNTATCWQ